MISARLVLLKEFISDLNRWRECDRSSSESREIRTKLNMNLLAARNAVYEAGALQLVTVSPPPAVGGLVHQNLDPFENLFKNFWGISMVSTAIDCVEQAIGVYEHLLSNKGLIKLPSRESIDVETAIERALRPYFRHKKPESEKEVQDAIENILISIGISYSREKEAVEVGAKSFIPDFTIHEYDLAIEVKLATDKHKPNKIQEEITADIGAYLTKWKRVLIVIYDLGVISDPYRFRHENMKLFGVSMIIIKH